MMVWPPVFPALRDDDNPDQSSQYRSKFHGIPDISVLSAGSDIFLPAEIDFLNICFTKK